MINEISKRTNNQKKTKEAFESEANLVHKCIYNYEKVVYINNRQNVIIGCKKHGDFQQRPSNHLRGQGCPHCGNAKKINTFPSTKEIFELKAKLVHENNNDYHKVVYVNSKEKVIITCKKHGDFLQTPSSHLKGHGCPKCADERKAEKFSSTKEVFEKRANIVHNNNYDYEKTVYVNSKEKVIITCKLHGDFEQTPNNHLRGQGCPHCANNQLKTKEEFESEANIVHNNNYNYEKTVYVNCDKKVIITCEKHGDFEQTPYHHLKGSGCPYCVGKFKTTPKFIDQVNEVHNYQYNYDKTVYVNNKEKVTITCKLHGDFQQTPSNHLKGSGCPKCARSFNKIKTNMQFVKEANLVHNNEYLYPNLNYKNSTTRIQIRCKKHGDFQQMPNNHLKGSGCPKCKSSKGEKYIFEVLQKSNIKFETQYKFEDCFSKKRLPFDFAVFENNKIALIEFYGEQHYRDVNFFGSKTKHEELKIRDKIKQDYAKEKGIDLLIIPYTEIHNIEPLVTDFIEKMKTQ